MPYNPYQTYPYQQPLDNLGQLRMWQQQQANEVLARTAPIPVPAYQVPAPYNVVPPVGGVPCPGV